MKKKITAAVLFCAVLLSTPVAMARLNWYDRVLQPIVTNKLTPAWKSLITNPLLAIYTVVFQIGQRMSPENLSPLFGIPILNPQSTQAEEHEKERIAYNEMFKSELSKVTTIETESPGIFAHVNQTIKDNEKDWEERSKEKKTVVNPDRDVYKEVLNRDERGEEKSNTPLALKVTLNSTPQAIKLLNPETRKETTDYLANYQIQVYNEKIKENEESLKRIANLMAELEKVMGAGYDSSYDKEGKIRQLNEELKNHQIELAVVEDHIANINARYNTRGTGITNDMLSQSKEAEDIASRLSYLVKEEEKLENESHFFSDVSERWEYLRKLNEIRKNIEIEENNLRKLTSAMDSVNVNFLNNSEKMTEELRPYNKKAEEIRKKMDDISKEIMTHQKNMGAVGTAQQEAERKVLISSLQAAIKDEQMKMKKSTERVQQVENMLNEQRGIVEQKVGIASMQYYGFDPYNPDEEDQKRGILPIEKLDRGYVTSKGLRKP